MRMRLSVLAALVLVSLSASGQEPYEVFMAKFEEAVKGDNYAMMKDLVNKNQNHVTEGFFFYENQYCSAVSNKSDEDKAQRINVLDKLANFVNQEFKDRMYLDRLAWVKTLTPEQAVKKLSLTQAITDGITAYTQGEKSGEAKDWTEAQAKFTKAVSLATELQDTYWVIGANYWLGEGAMKLSQGFEAAYYFKAALEIAREQKALSFPQVAKFQLPGRLKAAATKDGTRDDVIDVRVPVEESKKKYAAQIEKMAADAANPGGAPGAESKPGGAAGASAPKGAMPEHLPPLANKHTLRIEWTDADKPKYDQAIGRPVLTPNLGANSFWSNWYQTSVPPGGPVKLDRVPGENAIKNDKGKILFDPDGPGKASEEKIKTAVGKSELVTFKGRTFPDGTKVDVHHLVMEAPISFSVNGVGVSFRGTGPNDPKTLYWQGASSVSTKFAGHDITVFDDSANGKFDDYGDDSVIIGKGKNAKAVPLSRYIYLGDLLFEIKLDPNGHNFRFKPYDGPIALMQFEYVASTMPVFMILEGQNENAFVYFNLMDCRDKPMWVPAGEYRFKHGYFSFGEGEKRETIRVLNTKSSPVRITEGQLNKVAMGGAKPPGFTYVWKAEMEKDKGKTMIRILGRDIKVFGCAGEEYTNFFTGQFRPTVRMRSGKDGPVFYEKEMKPSAKEDLKEKGVDRNWTDILLFPKNIEVEKSVSGDAFIQLESDYPKLGKITSQPSQVQ